MIGHWRLTQIITLSAHDGLERPDGILKINQNTLNTLEITTLVNETIRQLSSLYAYSENLCNSEWLRQELLEFTGTLDSQLIGF